MNAVDLKNSLSEALRAIIKPIVEEAVQSALEVGIPERRRSTPTDQTYVTVKEAADISRLGSSTIRLYIRKRRLCAKKVGRRVLIKKTDLEAFLDSNSTRSSKDRSNS